MMGDSRSQPKDTAARHTATPWFVSGVRFRMNGGEWHSINRYDESLKRDENVACVGYDPRTGEGLADAHFIVEAVNSHASLKALLVRSQQILATLIDPKAIKTTSVMHAWAQATELEAAIRAALEAKPAGETRA